MFLSDQNGVIKTKNGLLLESYRGLYEFPHSQCLTKEKRIEIQSFLNNNINNDHPDCDFGPVGQAYNNSSPGNTSSICSESALLVAESSSNSNNNSCPTSPFSKSIH